MFAGDDNLKRRIRKKLFIVISLTFLVSVLVFVQAGMSAPEFEPRIDPYYWDTADKIMVRGLTIGNQYGILIGSNQVQSEQQWINFTADSQRAEVHFRQYSSEYDNKSERITELYIDLYEISSNFDPAPVFHDRLTLDIVFKQDQANYGTLVEQFVFLISILVLVLIIVSFIVYMYRRFG